MASTPPAPNPPSTNGVLLVTVARSASNMLIKSLLSGQDAARVAIAEYNFGAAIIEHHPRLVEHALDGEGHTPEQREQIWSVTRTSAAKTLGLFVNAGAEVRSLPLLLDNNHDYRQ